MGNEDQKVLQKHLINFLVSDVYNLISDEDILRVVDSKTWVHKGKKLTQGEINNLKEQAKTFLNSSLWKILKAELLWHAQDKGYRKSKTESDQIAGKLIEYVTIILEKRLVEMVKG